MEYQTQDQLRRHLPLLRKAHGWSQTELGKKIGLSQGAVSAFETAKTDGVGHIVYQKCLILVDEWLHEAGIVREGQQRSVYLLGVCLDCHRRILDCTYIDDGKRAVFCSFCGGRVARECPECGEAVLVKKDFCGDCGFRFAKEGEVKDE